MHAKGSLPASLSLSRFFRAWRNKKKLAKCDFTRIRNNLRIKPWKKLKVIIFINKIHTWLISVTKSRDRLKGGKVCLENLSMLISKTLIEFKSAIIHPIIALCQKMDTIFTVNNQQLPARIFHAFNLFTVISNAFCFQKKIGFEYIKKKFLNLPMAQARACK